MNHVKSPLFRGVKVHCSEPPLYYNAMILELCVTHLTMCAWVQTMHFGCRTYIPIFEFTPSYLQNSINFDSAILSCRRCTYKRIPALAVEQNNCAVLFYTGRYYLALNTAFFLPIYECQHQEQRLYCSIPSCTTAETVRSCAGINIKQSKPLLAVPMQLQEHVSCNQFHSQGINMSQEVAGGVV